MIYSVVLGTVIVALGIGMIVYTFWYEGSPLPLRRRHRQNGSG
ncbi:hypothetical protein [Actinacidiphila oryziradicis]|nr:hypothetical protein [Actinacidiphila oryziradicis]MCW2869931.1 hypothetical protein [Actinacidiphila oryziradicis]